MHVAAISILLGYLLKNLATYVLSYSCVYLCNDGYVGEEGKGGERGRGGVVEVVFNPKETSYYALSREEPVTCAL